MSVAKLKQHDTKGIFIDLLTVDGVPVDLTNTTIKFLMRKPGGALITGVAQSISPVVDHNVKYPPIAADVAQCGKYQQEWEVHFIADNRYLTFPNGTWNVVIIEPDLGGDAP